MSLGSVSKVDRWFVAGLSALVVLYGLHGLVLGTFYLPSRRGPSYVVSGVYVVIPLLACLLAACGLVVRVNLLFAKVQHARAGIELALLGVGVGLCLSPIGLRRVVSGGEP